MRMRTTAIWIVLVLGAASPTLPFDTGYHVDLTAAAMREKGFDETAIKAVQLSNWLTDYYSVSPTSRDPVQLELAKLHSDNLFDERQVSNYWGWLMHNAESALVQAAESDRPGTALTLLGLMLHTVQDFYSHSNWVEIHPRDDGGPYRRETWLADGSPDGVELFTGSYPPHFSPPPPGALAHGDYESGLNKDSLIRPLWEEAYVFAYCATHEVLDLVRQWVESVRPGFWTQLQELRLDDKELKRLDDDVEAAHSLSLWAKGKGSDGHWKGDESGSVRYMSKQTVAWAPSKASSFVREIKGGLVHELLTPHLYSGETSPESPEVRPFAGERRIVLVRTTHVEETRHGGGRIDPTGKADLYAIVRIGDQQYIDRTLRKKRSFEDPWLTLHFALASETEIPILIDVLDEDPASPGKPDRCDINPETGKKHLSFRLLVQGDELKGDVQGCHNTAESAFEVSGQKPDNHLVLLRAFVATQELRAR